MIEYTERKGTGCIKWDGLEQTFGADGLLPLWVADMDFRVDSHITDAIEEYLQRGVFGYEGIPDSYYDAFIDWEKSEHGLSIEREWIRYSPGVVSGFNFALQILSEPGDAVIETTPVYYPFFRAAENNGRKLICSELINRDGRYYINLATSRENIEDMAGRIISELESYINSDNMRGEGANDRKESNGCDHPKHRGTGDLCCCTNNDLHTCRQQRAGEYGHTVCAVSWHERQGY